MDGASKPQVRTLLLTDLVDSTSPQTSPTVMVDPTSGRSTKTSSPRDSTATEVMPTRTGASGRLAPGVIIVHSWSSVCDRRGCWT